MRAYAGIGSRDTSEYIRQEMSLFASFAAPKMILRSGGANGADEAFETGCDAPPPGQKEIFLPWKNFNKNPSPLHILHPKASALAERIHPYYKYMKRPAKLLVARNMQQILGSNLDDPVEFVICWTRDGAETEAQYTTKTGGTGSAIALASKLEIPVYNLFNPDRYYAATEHLARVKD